MGATAGIAGLATAGIGAGQAISGLAGGSSPTTYGGSSQTYIPYNQAGVDRSLNQGFGQISGAAGATPNQTAQGYTNYLNNTQNNPYSAEALSLAQQTQGLGQNVGWGQLGSAGELSSIGNTVSPYQQGAQSGLYGLTNQIVPQISNGIGQLQGAGQQTGASQYGMGTQLAGLSQAGTPYLQQLLQTGFDPNTAQYNQLQNQNSQQSNAINSMNGVAGSPYGAGLADQSNQNFNTAWNANQQARQQSAVQSYDSLLGSTGAGLSGAAALQGSGLQSLLSGYSGASGLGQNAISAANTGYGGSSNIGSQAVNSLGSALTGWSNLQNQGLQTMQSTSGLPYSTYTGQQSDQLSGLNNFSGGVQGSYGLLQQLLGSYSNYLGQGQSATGQGINAQGQQYGQQQQNLNNLGSSLGGLSGNSNLSNLFGGGNQNLQQFQQSVPLTLQM